LVHFSHSSKICFCISCCCYCKFNKIIISVASKMTMSVASFVQDLSPCLGELIKTPIYLYTNDQPQSYLETQWIKANKKTMPLQVIAHIPQHKAAFNWQDIDWFLRNNVRRDEDVPVPVLEVTNPLFQTDRVRTVIAEDAQDGKPCGAAAMVRLSDETGYLCFCQSEPDLQDRHVRVVMAETHGGWLTVAKTNHKPPVGFDGNFSKLHQSKPDALIHQFMFNMLTEKMFGIANFDQACNITVDIPKNSEQMQLFRDRLGFVVSESCQFVQLNTNIKAMHVALKKNIQQSVDSDHTILSLDFHDPEMLNALQQYDYKVSSAVRMEYVKYLHEALDVQFLVCHHNKSSAHNLQGYLMFMPEKILCMYAENEQAATALLYACTSYLTRQTANQVETIFCYSVLGKGLHGWAVNHLPKDAYKEMTLLRRMHTRCVPYRIRWSSVYAANIGWQIV
ncbi:hypothetical protein T12_5563, partial [Trichinella patagoniensis]